MNAPPKIENRRKGGWVRGFVRLMTFLVLSGSLVGGAVLGSVYVHYSEQLPPLPDMVVVPPPEVGTIHAVDGQTLGRYSTSWRTPLPYEKIPRTLLLAFLATEDARFFSHQGIDFRGILRAAIRNIRAGGVVEGGSTITQQLAKSLLTSEKTFDRKIKEALLSVQIEAKYTKEEILLLYLNRIYLGNGAHGIQAAAQHYFHRPVWELTLGEMALLGGLPAAPSRLDPTRNMDAALKRRRTVLNRMVSKGFITKEQAEAAAEEPLRVQKRKKYRSSVAPFCAEAVRKQMHETYGKDWASKGLQAFTTCDVQQTINGVQALQAGLEKLDRRQGWRGPLESNIPLDQIADILDVGRGPGSPPLAKEELVIAIVDKVFPKETSVRLAGNQSGILRLENHRWMAAYTEFPIVKTRDGREVRNRNGSVSLDRKTKTFEGVLSPGDAIMVRLNKKESNGAWDVEAVQVPKVEGAFLGADRVTGQVKSLVGSYDFGKNQVNRVHSIRQTGSLMKPIIYAKAYDMGLPASTLLSGAPFREGDYNPTGKKATEDKTAWDGLATSNNAISLRIHKYVLQQGSLESYQEWGDSMGLGTRLQGYTSEILGTEQSLWNMTQAYLLLALGGEKRTLQMIRKVVDAEGNILREHLHPLDEYNSHSETLRALWTWNPTQERTLLAPEASYITASNMHEVTTRGTGKKASRELDFPTAGKTGTLPYDVWFVGWSPDYIGGVWVGADRRHRVLGRSEKRNKVHGGNTALPIWIQWMKSAHGNQVSAQLLPHAPNNIEFPKIDPESGLLAQLDGRVIPHVRGTVPTEIKVKEPLEEAIDTENGGAESERLEGGANRDGGASSAQPPSPREAIPTPSTPEESGLPTPAVPPPSPEENKPLPSLDEILD